ncbi:GrpE nucleotide exchange factor coiled-coil [Penicillium robsamsonii]|uniref:GrpE nucleotide exchange factor coiled-coil n=1 Tax=Penicillium robsamsonii TaxID=1792511 RepID=UPI002547CCA7|nr:GrpE nucleotide exchange factor coiled-coil [Penicillium robsamsonii]KAJ5835916.1 GrpE nucleotide exchange factor coiled-coil [Penicillium robsamsonii]
MFQRTIFRQAQAARSILSTSPSTASLALRRTTQQPRIPAIRAFAPRSTRLYSTETKQATETETAENAEAEDPVKKELEQKTKESIEFKDKWLRSVADSRNLVERNKRDMDAARKFAIQGFAKDLLDSIDNFDRALLAVPAEKLAVAKTEENKDLHDLVAGLNMTQDILLNTLQKHGLERFDPAQKVDGKTQKFDANLHEATFMAPAAGLEDGDIMHVQSKGFKLNGRVLRAAKVGVVKNA